MKIGGERLSETERLTETRYLLHPCGGFRRGDYQVGEGHLYLIEDLATNTQMGWVGEVEADAMVMNCQELPWDFSIRVDDDIDPEVTHCPDCEAALFDSLFNLR